jgi:uncharacterized membrane protein
MRRFAGLLLLLLATLWATAIIAAPRVVASGAEHPVWSGLGGLTYIVGGLVCHQRPERSFHASGIQLPVCARCTGLYLAAPIGMAAALLFFLRRRRRRSGDAWRLALLAAMLPTVVSISLEWLGGPSGTVSRALAAIPLGAVAGAVVGAAVMGHFARDARRGNGV